MRTIPSAIVDLINLEYLDLSKNSLRVKDIDDTNCLPVEMRHLTNLKYLNLSECNLRYIPVSVWLCESLEILDLSRNKIGLLVPDIGNLQRLVTLNVSQCNLTTLPAEIGFCVSIKEIFMMTNQIENLPDALKDCKHLESLRFSYRSFSLLLDSYMENLISKGQIKSEHIPLVVFELEKLTSLDLKCTKINNLPDNNLRSIQCLNLDYNFISAFNENVLSPMVSSLRTLTMSNNLLREIPAELNCLVNLEVLDLSFNSIQLLANISKLVKLKELYIGNNKLISVNSNVKHLINLRKLALNENEITELSEFVFALQYLNYLDLSNNKLSRISPSIINLKFLTSAHSYEREDKTGLWLLGNPLKVPAKDIWQTTNINKIFHYLSTYEQRHLDRVYYSKLVFLGASGCGKSALVDSFFSITNVQETGKIFEFENILKYFFHLLR